MSSPSSLSRSPLPRLRRRSLLLAWLLRPLAAAPLAVPALQRSSEAIIRQGWILSPDD
jgi:hypothetical protein